MVTQEHVEHHKIKNYKTRTDEDERDHKKITNTNRAQQETTDETKTKNKINNYKKKKTYMYTKMIENEKNYCIKICFSLL